VEVRWSRVLALAFILTLAFVLVTLLVCSDATAERSGESGFVGLSIIGRGWPFPWLFLRHPGITYFSGIEFYVGYLDPEFGSSLILPGFRFSSVPSISIGFFSLLVNFGFWFLFGLCLSLAVFVLYEG